MKRQNHPENGNALFIILVVVVLLGALTMILSRGGSGVEQSGSYEQLAVQASEVLRFAKSIEGAVNNMTLSDVSENDISFANTSSTTDYTNANCDDNTDRSFPGCLIFDPRGEGMSYKIPNPTWLASANSGEAYYGDWLFTGNTCIPEIGDDTDANCLTGGTGNLELMVILPYVTLDLCQQINRISNASVTSANPPADDGNAWVDGSAHFTGSFDIGNGVQLSDNPIVDMGGSYTGCFQGGGTPAAGTYHFYHVIKGR